MIMPPFMADVRRSLKISNPKYSEILAESKNPNNKKEKP